MKRFFSILLINLLFLFSVFSIFEYLSYKRYEKIFKENFNTRNETQKKIMGSNDAYPYKTDIKLFDFYTYQKEFRKPLGENLKKKSIVIFGCSFAYGDGLTEKQTLSYKLYKKTKRPVYNKAFNGWSAQHMLYQLRMKDFYAQTGHPEYFIYVYMSDHIRRLYLPQWYFTSYETYLRYKLKNDDLEEIKPFLYQYWGLYSVRYLQEMYEKYVTLNPINEERNLNLLEKTIKESNSIMKKQYPGSKFIILVYKNRNQITEKETRIWSELEKSNIKILYAEDLLGDAYFSRKYTIADGHPNEKAWDVIVPKLAKLIN